MKDVALLFLNKFRDESITEHILLWGTDTEKNKISTLRLVRKDYIYPLCESTERKVLYLSMLQRHEIYFSNDPVLKFWVKVNEENRHLRALKIISCEECMCHL